MGDVAEATHTTLPRAATYATKIFVKILTAESATKSTAYPSLPVIVMTEDEQLRKKAARRFALGNVTNASSIPTLPRAAIVQPKKTNTPLKTRTTLTANAASANATAAATAALAATSTVADDHHDPFKGMTAKKKGIT